MRHKIKKYLAVLILAILPLLSFAESEPVKANQPTMLKHVISFEKLTTHHSIALKGRSPSYTFYLPQPKQWKIDHIVLDLVFSHSEALKSDSTLTIFVNDVPLRSIKLDDINKSKRTWQIVIPEKSIKRVSTAIKIGAYLKISDDHCQDDDNEANWVKIDGESSLTFFYHKIVYQPNIDPLPYPFVNNQSSTADSFIVITQDKSWNRFSDVFNFAYIFSRYANWRGLNINWLNYTSFLSEKKNTNIVLIGKTMGVKKMMQDRQEFYNDKVNPLIDKAYTHPDSGFLILTQSPWDPYFGVLSVISDTDIGLKKAILALSKKDVLDKLSDIHSVAVDRQVSENHRSIEGGISFEDLGYDDQIVYGEGKHKIEYRVMLPPNHKAEFFQLKVDYSYAPFLSAKIPSYLTLSINNVPLTGLKLKADDRLIHTWKVEIPSRMLKPGVNVFQFQFNIHLVNPTCSKKISNSVWAKINNSTTLSVKLNHTESLYKLEEYKDYFTDKDVIVALPTNYDFLKNNVVQNGLIKFSQTLPTFRSAKFIKNSDITQSMLEENNIIYLGSLNSNSAVKNFFFDHLKQINKNLIVSKQQPIEINKVSELDLVKGTKKANGVVFLYYTNPTRLKSVLLVIADEPSAFAQTLSLLEDDKKLKLLEDNLALSFYDKTFTTISTQETKRISERTNIVETTGNISKVALIIAIIVFLFFIIFIAYRLSIKLSQLKEHSKKDE